MKYYKNYYELWKIKIIYLNYKKLLNITFPYALWHKILFFYRVLIVFLSFVSFASWRIYIMSLLIFKFFSQMLQTLCRFGRLLPSFILCLQIFWSQINMQSLNFQREILLDFGLFFFRMRVCGVEGKLCRISNLELFLFFCTKNFPFMIFLVSRAFQISKVKAEKLFVI